MKRHLQAAVALGVLLLLGGGFGCAGPKARLEGRVVESGAPVPGAYVELRRLDAPLQRTTLSDPDGRYRFAELPAGAYHLEARHHGPPPRVASPGTTPVHLAPDSSRWLGLQLVPLETPVLEPLTTAGDGFGSVGGRLWFEGEPVAGAVVNAYLDALGGLRGPGFRQSLPSGPDGRYFLDGLPAGRYHLAARQRAGGAGPVREGDLYAAPPANPVAVRDGHETRLDIHLVRKERDTAPDQELLQRDGTGLRGRVVDPRGHPLAGLYVFAYRNRIIGHGMPDFLTLPTAADGRFELPLGTGGLFYVGARQHAGGSPRPGEWFGLYEGSPDHAIRVSQGSVLEDVEIVVHKVLAP